MKAIILAGGRGERLRPLTNNIPKPMVEVNGKHVLLHIINLFKKHGIKDFIIALCFLPYAITEFFGDGKKFGINITYTFEDPQNPLGTAGAISLSKNLIDDTFIVTYGDILRDLDINKMIKFHKKNNSSATINVYNRFAKTPGFQTGDEGEERFQDSAVLSGEALESLKYKKTTALKSAEAYKRKSHGAKSMIKFSKNKKIVKFIERPSENDLKDDYIWSNGSFYIFEPEIFDFIPENSKVDFGLDIFPQLLASKKSVYAFTTESYFVDIGNLEKLEFARRSFKSI